MKNLPGQLLVFLLNAISRLSWKTMYRISDVLRWVMFDLFKYCKQVIANNLERSFPGKSAAERHQIQRAFYPNLSDIIVEPLELSHMSRQKIGPWFASDLSLLEKYYQQGQARFLEADVRQQPANWLWSHKRWKHRRPNHLAPSQLLEKAPHRERQAR